MDKITIERETLQAALKALDKCARTLDEFPAWSVAGHEASLAHQSIANLRAALAAQPAPAATDMNMPLPEPDAHISCDTGKIKVKVPVFVGETVRAIVAAEVAKERERCLAEIETGIWIDKTTSEILDACAAAIRAGSAKS